MIFVFLISPIFTLDAENFIRFPAIGDWGGRTEIPIDGFKYKVDSDFKI